jgi:hypothetical protein
LTGKDPQQNSGIGTLQEMSLHAALKDWYAQPVDALEVPVGGYLIDIVRGSWLVEIQTANFTAIKKKLKALLPDYRVRLVHPIAQDRWIKRVNRDNQFISRRKSPKHGRLEEVFTELVRLPNLVCHPNFYLEVLLIKEEVIWRDDGQGSWRRKGWSVADRRLVEVVEATQLDKPEQYAAMLPSNLSRPFTNQELSRQLGLSRRLAEKMTYCLRKMNLLELVGKKGRHNLYSEPDEGKRGLI